MTQVDRLPFPIGMFTTGTVIQHIMDITRRNPVDIDVMNDYNVIVQMESKGTLVPVVQALYNTHMWDGHAAKIICSMPL